MGSYISEDVYYNYMSKMNDKMQDSELRDRWHKCFSYAMKYISNSFNQSSIDELFYNWEMEGWDVMWLENSPMYKDKTKTELLECFCSECHYICDRVSFDRLFSAHWLFRKAGMLDE